MFQKSKINEPIDPRSNATPASTSSAASPAAPRPAERVQTPVDRPTPAAVSRPATPSTPSVIGHDLKVVGNLLTDGDLHVEGLVEGDVDARTLIVGDNAHVMGEIRAIDVTVNGKVTGRIKGQKVRLASSARVDGDITHSSLAMEEGADFEGSIHRAEDPLKGTRAGAASQSTASAADSAASGS